MRIETAAPLQFFNIATNLRRGKWCICAVSEASVKLTLLAHDNEKGRVSRRQSRRDAVRIVRGRELVIRDDNVKAEESLASGGEAEFGQRPHRGLDGPSIRLSTEEYTVSTG